METITQEHYIELTDADIDAVSGGEPMLMAALWTNYFTLTVVASPSNYTWAFEHTR